ncbi:MAG TPA: C13 family peptidase [Ramlibacter sp.]|uniref:C13 family peptidase n=1 Tax=Ramlibacter sp. TaxID=1917967 RepID=UPI002D7F956F|nr:C13 family peptidase [Ramlibacter sp.]HET8744176.1 C13 family peptidase [Ramlibacter sp.]
MNETVAEAMGLRGWLREGLRAAFLRTPHIGNARVRPRELLAIALLSIAIEIVLGRLEVDGPAIFNLRAWLAPYWSVAAILVLLWPLLGAAVGGWLALWLVAALVPGSVSQLLGIAHAHGVLPTVLDESMLFAWACYLLLWTWTMAIVVSLGRSFGLRQRRLAGMAGGMFLVFAVTAWQFPERAWEAPTVEAVDEELPKLVLTQENFEIQQAAFERAIQALAPQRPGVTDVYGLVFAPYAAEDVFLKESTLVADLLAQRFDAKGRVLQLVNHVDTVESLPWATPLNLKRAIEAIAARMDREHDLLVVYLTSHAASDFQLEAAHPPLTVESVSPGELRVALDEAGIRNRVIAISACYSGGWVGPLARNTTLVMTAADAEHTSYGCGRLSDLTYFGRAVFDEQLRRTHSFEEAFAAAVPVIRQREEEAGKPDGFSNPQISVGEGLRPVLKQLQARLDATPIAARP